MAIHFFVNFDILNGCILLTFGSIYTKLGDFVKLGLHFIAHCRNVRALGRVSYID